MHEIISSFLKRTFSSSLIIVVVKCFIVALKFHSIIRDFASSVPEVNVERFHFKVEYQKSTLPKQKNRQALFPTSTSLPKLSSLFGEFISPSQYAFRPLQPEEKFSVNQYQALNFDGSLFAGEDKPIGFLSSAELLPFPAGSNWEWPDVQYRLPSNALWRRDCWHTGTIIPACRKMAMLADREVRPVADVRTFAEMERHIAAVEEDNKRRKIGEEAADVYIRITAHVEDYQLAYSTDSDLSSFDPLFYVLIREEAKSSDDEPRFLWLLLEQEQVEDILGLQWREWPLPQFEGKMLSFFGALCPHPLFSSRTFFFNLLRTEDEENDVRAATRRAPDVVQHREEVCRLLSLDQLCFCKNITTTTTGNCKKCGKYRSRNYFAAADTGSSESGRTAAATANLGSSLLAEHQLARATPAAPYTSSIGGSLVAGGVPQTGAKRRLSQPVCRGSFKTALEVFSSAKCSSTATLVIEDQGGEVEDGSPAESEESDREMFLKRENEIRQLSQNPLYSFLIEVVPKFRQKQLFYNRPSFRLYNFDTFSQISPQLLFVRGLFGGIAARP